MKTDWKSLKGKNVLIKYVKKDYILFKTYSDRIDEHVVAEVSPTGRFFREKPERWWIDTKGLKLLEVL